MTQHHAKFADIKYIRTTKAGHPLRNIQWATSCGERVGVSRLAATEDEVTCIRCVAKMTVTDVEEAFKR